MPIYAYRCSSCGHAQDVMQKIADAPLTICTSCGAATFAKQITAAGFQLKGSGWYATDFKNGSSKKSETKPSTDSDNKLADSKSADSKPADSKPTDTAPKSEPSSAAAHACGSGGCASCS